MSLYSFLSPHMFIQLHTSRLFLLLLLDIKLFLTKIPWIPALDITCHISLFLRRFLNYGESEWRAEADKCLAQLDTFSEDVRNNFVATLDWMNEHACSRSYGLGSRMPWDEQYLIESLSDSTVYMAYYTINHLLQVRRTK